MILGWVFGVKLSNEDIADFEVLRDVAMATIFGFLYIWGAHWRHLKNTTEPSMCGGDAALCQITLTTCFIKKATKTQLHKVENSDNLQSIAVLKRVTSYRASTSMYSLTFRVRVMLS